MPTNPYLQCGSDLSSAGRVISVRALPLLGSSDVVAALPDWAIPTIRSQPCPWPEETNKYVLEVEAEDGTRGQYGPCSRAVIELVRDQLAILALGIDCHAYRLIEQRVAWGRHRSGAHYRIAFSALELALWDLRSKVTGRSIVQLLGGPTRSTVPLYASALGIDVDHPLALEVARWLTQQGFAGQKWGLPGYQLDQEPKLDAERLERLRAAIGPDVPLMVDSRGAWSQDYLQRMLPILAGYDVAWIEEPVSPGREIPPNMLRASGISVPIAGGEHAYDAALQIRLLIDRQINVWQPDIGWHGGIIQAIRTTELAGLLGIRVFPHGGCLAGALIVAGIVDPVILPAVEYHLTMEPRRQVDMLAPLVPVQGHLPVPNLPGITGGYVIDACESAVILGTL